MPGKDASKNDTREFGGAEKPTDEPENSLVLELIWAWISKPTTPTSCWGALWQRGARHGTDRTKQNKLLPHRWTEDEKISQKSRRVPQQKKRLLSVWLTGISVLIYVAVTLENHLTSNDPLVS